MRTIGTKVRNFAFFSVGLQSIPIALYALLAFLAGGEQGANAGFDWTASFLLLALAWLSIPNYLSEHPWSAERRSRYAWLATGVGLFLVLAAVTISVFTTLIRAAELRSPTPLAPRIIRSQQLRNLIDLVTDPLVASICLLTLLLAALLFLWLAHKKLLKKASLRLLWKHQAQFVGFYCAKRRGFFESRGLSVTIDEVEPSSHPRMDFLPTAANFAVLSAPDVIKARAEGLRVRSLVILVRDSNIVFFAHSDSGIRSVADFGGRKVGVRMGYEEYPILLATLDAAGVDVSTVEMVDIRNDITPFLNREVDVWAGHVACEPAEAIMRGAQIQLFPPEEYGVTMSGETLVTTDHMVSVEPDVVRAFVDATREGWEFAYKNQEEAFSDVLAFVEDQNHEGTNYQREMQLELLALVFREGKFPSRQTETEWRYMIDLARKHNMIAKEVQPEALVW